MRRGGRIKLEVLVTVILLTVLVFLNFPRSSSGKMLPSTPEKAGLSIPLRHQIYSTIRKAKRNASSGNIGNLALVYFSAGYSDKAMDCFRISANIDTAGWLWNYYLGYMNARNGQSEQALANFMKVAEKSPENTLALFYMGEALQNLGRTDEAISILRKVEHSPYSVKDTLREKSYPLSVYAEFSLARIYSNIDKRDSAEVILARLLDRDDTFGPAYRLMGNIYSENGDSASSKEFKIRANDFIGYEPPADELIDRIALISRSETYLLKEIDDAVSSLNFKWELKLFDQALKYCAESKFIISKVVIGYLYLGIGEKSLPYLEKHIAWFSDEFNELLHIATLLFDQGFRDYAMKYLDRAEEQSPGEPRLVHWLEERGMYEKAINLLNRQLQDHPGDLTVLSNAVSLYVKMGLPNNAEEYLRLMEVKNPESASTRIASARIAEAEKRIDDAIIDYTQALASEDKDLSTIVRLASLYARRKDWNNEIKNLKLGLETFPNEPILLQTLGNILISCPDQKYLSLNEGIKYTIRAFTSYRSFVVTKVSAGKDLIRAYGIIGDMKKANEYLNRTIQLIRKNRMSEDNIAYLENLASQYKIQNN